MSQTLETPLHFLSHFRHEIPCFDSVREVEYSITPDANQSVVQCNTPDNFSEVTCKLEQLQVIIPEAGSEYQAGFQSFDLQCGSLNFLSKRII